MAHDVEVNLGDHTVQSGAVLIGDVVRGRLYGKAGAPIIVVLGGISATRFVAQTHQGMPGWWSAMVRDHGPIDLTQTQVLGLDFAPGDQDTDQDIPITSFDQAKRLEALLNHLGIAKVKAIIGASYGGMVALAFAKSAPTRIENLCIISAAHQPFALGVAWRGIQRRIVRMALEAGRPEEGLALARELAMTTYRSAEEFSARFDGRPSDTLPHGFDVCEYLVACGRKFSTTMSARRFLALSESIDLHNVRPEDITTPALLIASRSDQLAPPSQMQGLHDRLCGRAKLLTLDSPFGHDAFLKETESLGTILAALAYEKHYAA